jgi:hypothetical protein
MIVVVTFVSKDSRDSLTRKKVAFDPERDLMEKEMAMGSFTSSKIDR